ncbi:hypothetical protein BC941DRAFT_426668 [Chlamydoabsidia padenii]|nr:hypothetical protein BC941DRAFT_426668 [Chlamydoabsidia padenii]
MKNDRNPKKKIDMSVERLTFLMNNKNLYKRPDKESLKPHSLYSSSFNMTIAFLFLTAFFLCPTWASLSGSNWITPQVYVGLDHLDGAGAPACGMSYASLDLSRITAVQDLDLSTDCTKCIKVVNTRKPSKYVYVLAVDLGGAGLGKVIK